VPHIQLSDIERITKLLLLLSYYYCLNLLEKVLKFIEVVENIEEVLYLLLCVISAEIFDY